MTDDDATTTTGAKTKSLGDRLRQVQERFAELWKKSAAGQTTPEENAWLLQVQEEYWKNHHDPEWRIYDD